MSTVKIRFPGGRYHATPWGHHVNEGLVEWPPSPWRLLRALIASGFSSQGWSDVPAPAISLIEKLASVLPFFRLPEASAAHSRHYMPLGTLDKGREKTALVFDTWASVGDREMLIHWPCELTSEETALLGQLVSALGYLGRSESWVEAELIGDGETEWNAVPCQTGEHRGHGWEQVSLMAAIPSSKYESWRSATVQETLKPFEGQKQTAAVKKKINNALAPYPDDLHACLMLDTATWKGHGWSQPPGSQRVLYWRRMDALQVSVPRESKRGFAGSAEMMLLSLTTPTGNRSALPPSVRTVPQAELFHRSIVSRAGKGKRVQCPELTGRDDQDRPLRDSHQHAYTVPLDLDGDNRLDHILMFAAMGLGGRAQKAIREVRETWRKKGPELQVALAGHGDFDSLRRLPGKLGDEFERVIGPVEGSRIWESATPFVPPRFLKARGKNTLFGQLIAELASRGLPEIDDLQIIPELTRKLRHYVRRRNLRHSQPPIDIGYGLRLFFKNPVSGPMLLGYASHYGLGRFNAVLE